MKRAPNPRSTVAVIVLAAGIFLLACLPAFSQAAENKYPTDVYVKTVHIVKIWMHPLGYMIQFWTSKSKIGEVYVPVTWFNKGPDSRADIVYGQDPAYPYFSVFWADGKFDHVVIHALSDYRSPTWGVLETATDRSSQFNAEELPKDY
jgi:hypothetical protein